jgi:two-component system, NtrC family, response regulator HydG
MNAAVTGRRILVADDDESVRMGLVANLELEGYSVTEACDGAQALQLLDAQNFDLVISDVVMPQANGVDVLRGLKMKNPATPLVLISAFVSETMVSEAIDEGLYTMLYKPVAMNEVLRVVGRALSRRTMLLVDDAQPYLSGLAASLTAAGHEVQAFSDGASAVNFVRHNAVDVCVLDLMMTPSDGVEICQQLRAIDRDVDIIAITGSSDPELVRRISRQGVATCLRKPFEIRDLLGALVKTRSSSLRKRS